MNVTIEIDPVWIPTLLDIGNAYWNLAGDEETIVTKLITHEVEALYEANKLSE